MRKRNFEILRWPSELPANQCRPVSPLRQRGRPKLAGNSEGHRGNVIFFVIFVFYDHFWYFKSQFVEVAFFYHLKSQSYIVLGVANFLLPLRTAGSKLSIMRENWSWPFGLGLSKDFYRPWSPTSISEPTYYKTQQSKVINKTSPVTGSKKSYFLSFFVGKIGTGL